MPELDALTYLQLTGFAVTWLAAIGFWFWRIRASTGTDKDMIQLLLLVGGCIFLTLVQFIALMARLG